MQPRTSNYEEETMKPDLTAMAAVLERHQSMLGEFNEMLSDAQAAAIGGWDKEKDEEADPLANGDDFTIYEEARKRLNEARIALGSITALLAQQQGLRDFEAAAVS